ncbi:MAG: putative toxin-antitoxin system toxin component, PIN family [Gomphosphaeria aponina SAG 52.96 = DSM 107014]|uniref:Toxin-antitoxin system toxin component, PIN family n=1 Tax=Gomphosphaeria aponina SAG 52.96 = DSM 107014 TaxID=1521640 RepID=A0A941GPY9_9CHRO|nr:putative toxin-antitoxin system toxin component, PIN family [Gomphosphaeria aponina SAG 52.96 = DSM 107014]
MKLSEKPVLRIVLDTNILISALLRKNTPPYLLYQAWRESGFDLVTSQEQLEELQRVMAYRKLQRYFTQEEARKMLSGIINYGMSVGSLPSVSYSPDPDDNIILATAIAGHADYIVSGDKSDLLELNVVEDIPIITARQGLDILKKREKD